MKNILMIVTGIILRVILTIGYNAWNNPTENYSGSMQILSKTGNISITEGAVIYSKQSNSFSIQELEAIAKVGTLREGLYIVTPNQ